MINLECPTRSCASGSGAFPLRGFRRTHSLSYSFGVVAAVLRAMAAVNEEVCIPDPMNATSHLKLEMTSYAETPVPAHGQNASRRIPAPATTMTTADGAGDLHESRESILPAGAITIVLLSWGRLPRSAHAQQPIGLFPDRADGPGPLASLRTLWLLGVIGAAQRNVNLCAMDIGNRQNLCGNQWKNGLLTGAQARFAVSPNVSVRRRV